VEAIRFTKIKKEEGRRVTVPYNAGKKNSPSKGVKEHS
jgi:hypothetical protein